MFLSEAVTRQYRFLDGLTTMQQLLVLLQALCWVLQEGLGFVVWDLSALLSSVSFPTVDLNRRGNKG